ncbi:GreA/GreB family elongation factor [Pseudoalteromonas sp. MMG010]|uniref:GreA/GreB family elongation factor n=1 Tax=Pseudoalteromonas sp. MMG010 TaxID=2822685 RepID=UPI001B39D31A|nr:GreA/GreB family elongation factor [Pseudoalteromonas sp. MMG010]MBQ4832294.1 GreA/GreB family elongation factor [Pseudoalteromonas sp. MMG010]
MNKSHVIEHLKFALETQLNNAKQAAQAAHDAATHEESVAETQYDTLGLEAAYLAQGQAERVNDCYSSIKQFESCFKEPCSNKVTVGSLVCLEQDHAPHKWFFLGPASGGLSVQVKNNTIHVVTPSAPMGIALLNKMQDDEITLTLAGVAQHYIVDTIL